MLNNYQIIISGDANLVGTMYLTDEEVKTFEKIIKGLEPDGRWAPAINIINLTACETAAAEEKIRQEKAKQEEAKKIAEVCSHIGKYKISDKYPQLMTMFA